MSKQSEYLKRIMTRKREISMFKDCEFLSSGSTLLDLACTGTIKGAWPVGTYNLFVGDTSSGKTWVGMATLAEASINKKFKDYRLIYDGGEFGALMSVKRYFGERLAGRIEPPCVDEDGEPSCSQTVEELYCNLDDAFEAERPFVWIVDSMDSLSSMAEVGKFKSVKEAVLKGKDVTGSFGDGKAKVNSANLRRLMTPLKESGSVLLILNQTRDSFDLFTKSTRSGGRALGFYAQIEVWSSVKRKLKKTVRGRERSYGIESKMMVKRSRVTGLERSVFVPILVSCGIDDVGSMIDYLVQDKVWKKKGTKVDTEGFIENCYTRERLVREIEAGDLELKLKALIQKEWLAAEKACEFSRKNRYS